MFVLWRCRRRCGYECTTSKYFRRVLVRARACYSAFRGRSATANRDEQTERVVPTLKNYCAHGNYGVLTFDARRGSVVGDVLYVLSSGCRRQLQEGLMGLRPTQSHN